MPVTIEYVVEREGMEKAIFTSKAEADAYDKLLDTADNLSQLLKKSTLLEDKEVQELSLYLAKNRDALITALAQKRRPPASKAPEENTTKSSKKSKKAELAPQPLLDIVIEPDEDMMLSNESSVIDRSNEVAA